MKKVSIVFIFILLLTYRVFAVEYSNGIWVGNTWQYKSQGTQPTPIDDTDYYIVKCNPVGMNSTDPNAEYYITDENGNWVSEANVFSSTKDAKTWALAKTKSLISQSEAAERESERAEDREEKESEKAQEAADKAEEKARAAVEKAEQQAEKYGVDGTAGGSWQHDGTGKWYKNADGSYPQSNVYYIDGMFYVFDDNGYVVGTQDGYKSVSDAKGAANNEISADFDESEITGSAETNSKAGWNQNEDGWWYCTKAGTNNRYSDGIYLINGKYYKFDSEGILDDPIDGCTRNQAEEEWGEDWESEKKSGSNNSDKSDGDSGTITKAVVTCDVIDLNNGAWDRPPWWWKYSDYESNKSHYPKNCVGKEGSKYYAFGSDGYLKGDANGYGSAEEAAQQIGKIAYKQQSSIKQKQNKQTDLVVTDIDMPDLRETSTSALKFALEDIHDEQNGKVLRGASNFNILGTEYKETKLVFNKDIAINTMEGKNKKSTPILVKATKVSDGIMDLQVGGTIFRSFPYKYESDKTIKIHKTLFSMLESCYIDINQNNKADVDNTYSYARLNINEDFMLQYVYYMCLSDDGETADFYTIPLFLFKINGQFIEVKASNENSGNQFKVTIPGVSDVTVIKEGFLAKGEPMDIFDKVTIINPPVSNVNEITVSELKDEGILQVEQNKVTLLTKDDLDNIDLVSAYSIGNNVYLTNNINAVTLTNNITNAIDDIDDNTRRENEIDIMRNNMTQMITGSYFSIIKIAVTYVVIVISLSIILMMTSLGRVLYSRKIDVIKFLTFGRIEYMTFSILKIGLYLLVVLLISFVAQVLFYIIVR